ncbi:MAG: single-stranded DNA-binding protein [bacterium]|nr:single-stranded DNA-binding protein [bacterium]
MISGWVGARPKDYPERDGKQRFVRLDVATNPPNSEKDANFVAVNAYGEMAGRIIDGLWIRRGDEVRVAGFLSTRHANPGCGRRHRFTVVVATDFELLRMSKSRPEARWRNVPRPPLLTPGKPSPF